MQTHPLAPLEPWLNDPDVIDIMVDGYSKVSVRRRSLGREFEDVSTPFRGHEHLMEVIDTTIALTGRMIDPWAPFVDVCLPDGSQLSAMVPPLTSIGPALTIRKSLQGKLTLTELVRFGFWSQDMVVFLRACIRSRLNLVVSGGTASGKTTVLSILAGMIPRDERVITVVPADSDVRLPKSLRYVLSLQGGSAAIKGNGDSTSQHLLRKAPHMCPDRILIGEFQGAEVLELLQATNTQREGSLTTVQANSPRDVLARLEMMAMSADPSLAVLNVRQRIASTIDLVTYQEHMPDGSRRMLRVAEVLGMRGDVVELQDIFEYRQEAGEDGDVTGHFTATGHVPRFLQRATATGVEMPPGLFTPQ